MARNARICASCGFPNSPAKNYCDKCGDPVSELAPKSDIPPARLNAAEPGAPQDAHDPWPDVMPAGVEEAPKPPRRIGTLHRMLAAAFTTTIVIASLVTVWYWNEYNKPENAVHRAGVQYLDALRARDYAAAYSQFSDSARKHCTLDEFRASRDTSTWTWSNPRIERLEPGAAVLAYELAIAGAPPRTDRILFIKEIAKGDAKWVRPYSWTLMRKVEEAFDENNADTGLALAQAAATINPRDPMAHGYLCEAAYHLKSPTDIERRCVTALELSRMYPSNLSLKSLYRLHAILADTYKNILQKPDLALDQFSQMLAFPNISPADQCEILLARCEAYMTLSRPGEALADANRAGQLCVRPQNLAYVEDIRRKLNAPDQ